DDHERQWFRLVVDSDRFPIPGRNMNSVVVDKGRRVQHKKADIWHLHRLKHAERHQAFVLHQHEILALGKPDQAFSEMDDGVLAFQFQPLGWLLICLYCFHFPSLGAISKSPKWLVARFSRPRTAWPADRSG